MDAPQSPLGKPSLSASRLAPLAEKAATPPEELAGEFDDTNPLGRAPSKWRTLGAGKTLLPGHRIQFCHSKVGFGRDSIDVMKKNDSVYFAGVHRCGSVWACPVCSARISEGRRRELQTAIDQAAAQGHGTSLATFTFSHGLHDALADLVPRFRTALRRLKSGRAWQAIKTEFGIVHTAKAVEVTHGRVNGWHPHEHQLLFTMEPLSKQQLADMQKAIFPLWLAACKKAGLPAPSAERGLQIQGATQAAQYVGKFGFASELTRAPSKKGKLSGRTQWDLLRDYMDGDAQAGELFKEYVAAFARTRQLVWSRNARKWLQLGELFSDQQLADADEDDAKLLIELDLDTWALITRGDWLEEVVETAKLGRDVLLEFLNWLRDHCPLWDGRIVGARTCDDWRPDPRKRAENQKHIRELHARRRNRGRAREFLQ